MHVAYITNEQQTTKRILLSAYLIKNLLSAAVDEKSPIIYRKTCTQQSNVDDESVLFARCCHACVHLIISNLFKWMRSTAAYIPYFTIHLSVSFKYQTITRLFSKLKDALLSNCIRNNEKSSLFWKMIS